VGSSAPEEVHVAGHERRLSKLAEVRPEDLSKHRLVEVMLEIFHGDPVVGRVAQPLLFLWA
jgi:hypothetical protein